jgi:hypothetical protein
VKCWIAPDMRDTRFNTFDEADSHNVLYFQVTVRKKGDLHNLHFARYYKVQDVDESLYLLSAA